MTRGAPLRVQVVAGACLALACWGPAAWRYEAALAETPEPSAHAVHEARLGELMRELDQLRSARLPQAIDPQAEAARQARQIARIATAMAASAQQIPTAAPADLTPERRAEFEAMASRLGQLCDDLAATASELELEERRARLAVIDDTCRGCHESFRIPGLGPHAD